VVALTADNRPLLSGDVLPVLALASGPISASINMWVALALLILVGGWAIRWTTEQKGGRYSNAWFHCRLLMGWPAAGHDPEQRTDIGPPANSIPGLAPGTVHSEEY